MSGNHFTKTLERRIASIHAASGYINTTCYINRTGGLIYIKDRTGCITEIPTSSGTLNDGYPYGCLIIQEINTTSIRNHESWKHQVTGIGAEYCMPRHIARSQAPYAEELRIGDRVSTISTFVVDLTGSMNGGKIKYIPEYDVVVIAGSSFETAALASHPATRVDQIKESAREFVADKDAYIKIRYIQNSQTKDQVWIIFDDKILEAKPVVNNALESGIYISYRCSSTGKEMADYFESVAHAREKKCDFKLFTSKQEALIWLSESETQVQRMKLEEARLKAEGLQASVEKAKKDAEMLERKYAEDALRHKNAMNDLKLQNQRMKREAIAKELENSRKNTSDTFRYVATIISSLITLGAVFKKK